MNISTKEALKEIGRWAILFIVSWVATQVLAQVGNVPEFANIKIWVFTFSLPIRETFAGVFTFIGAFADKYIHENGKEVGDKTRGLLPFFPFK